MLIMRNGKKKFEILIPLINLSYSLLEEEEEKSFIGF